MFTTVNLADHPYAQCRVRQYTDGSIEFISYSTTVIRITPSGWLHCFGTYSQTTRRQISWFLREYAPLIGYQTAKLLYTDGYAMNIRTGELQKIIK